MYGGFFSTCLRLRRKVTRHNKIERVIVGEEVYRALSTTTLKRTNRKIYLKTICVSSLFIREV